MDDDLKLLVNAAVRRLLVEAIRLTKMLGEIRRSEACGEDDAEVCSFGIVLARDDARKSLDSLGGLGAEW